MRPDDFDFVGLEQLLVPPPPSTLRSTVDLVDRYVDALGRSRQAVQFGRALRQRAVMTPSRPGSLIVSGPSTCLVSCVGCQTCARNRIALVSPRAAAGSISESALGAIAPHLDAERIAADALARASKVASRLAPHAPSSRRRSWPLPPPRSTRTRSTAWRTATSAATALPASAADATEIGVVHGQM